MPSGSNTLPTLFNIVVDPAAGSALGSGSQATAQDGDAVGLPSAGNQLTFGTTSIDAITHATLTLGTGTFGGAITANVDTIYVEVADGTKYLLDIIVKTTTVLTLAQNPTWSGGATGTAHWQ